MLAFGAEEKAVQPLVLPHGVNAIEATGKHLVDVALVTDVDHEPVVRRGKNAMERNGQLDNAEIGSEMTAGLREDLDQLIAHFLRELRKALLRQRFHDRRRMNPIEQTGSLLGDLRRG